MYHLISANNHPHIASNQKQLTSVSVSNPLYLEVRSNSPRHPQQWSWLPILDLPQGCSSMTACWWCIPPVPWVYPCRMASENSRWASGGVRFLGNQLRTWWLQCHGVSIRYMACRHTQNRPSVVNYVTQAPLFEISKLWIYVWIAKWGTYVPIMPNLKLSLVTIMQSGCYIPWGWYQIPKHMHTIWWHICFLHALAVLSLCLFHSCYLTYL